ncbi:MAG: hypothetical protein AB7E32_05145 [Desulfovibrio sp.]
MLFYICNDLSDALQANDNNVITFLRSAAEAWRRGLHIITGMPKTLLEISKSNNLDNRTRQLFKQITRLTIREYSNYNTIHRFIFVQNSQTVEHRHICLSPQEADVFILSKTHLLLENLSDEPLYRTIAELYCHNQRLQCKINYHPENGNGGQIVDTYKMFDNTIPCLCIVDSDKTSPYSKPNSKSTAYKITSVESPSRLAKVIVIPVHEVENLLPVDIVIDYRSKNGGISDEHKIILRILQTCKRHHRFADLKTGMAIDSIVRKCDRNSSKHFWLRFAFRTKIQILNQELECGDKDCVSCEKSADCKYSFIPKSNVALNRLNISLQSFLEHSNNSKHLRVLWEMIGREITAWSCSSNPTVSF